MGGKRWVLFDEFNCQECGEIVMINTDSKKDGYFYDGDEIKCADGNCRGRGWVSVFDEDDIGFCCEVEDV